MSEKELKKIILELNMFCLKCKKKYEGDPNDSLCPECLELEFGKMKHGDPSGYLFANLKYIEKLKNK